MNRFILFLRVDNKEMIPVGGLEPPRIAATDFESSVSNSCTTQTLNVFATLAYRAIEAPPCV